MKGFRCTNVVNDLVRNTPVVLEDIVIGGAAGSSNFLCDGLDGSGFC